MLRVSLLLLAAAVALQVVFMAPTLAIARAVGARVSGLAVGTPILLRREIRGVKVALGLLPVMSYVQFPGMLPHDDDRSPGSWRALGLGARLLLLAGPWAVALAITAVFLGAERATLSFAHAVQQLTLVVDLTPLVRGFLRLLATEPVTVALGVVLAKATAFNLLPVGTLAGGRILGELVGALRGAETADEEKPTPAWFVLSGLCLIAWVWGRILWGLFQALR